MEMKFKTLAKNLNVTNYDDLEREDYINCGFSEEEAKILMDIFYYVCGVGYKKEDAHIEFVLQNMEYVNEIRLIYYFEYYLIGFSQNREKYEKAKTLVALVIENYNELFDYSKGYISEINTLNELLVLSTKMNIQTLEMIGVVYEYTSRTGELANFTKSIAHALYKVDNKDYEEKFYKLHIKKMDSLLKIKDVHSLNNYIDKIEDENNKIFDCSAYKEPLYVLYLELGNYGRRFIELNHLQKAVEGFKLIGNKSMEEKALAALESLINNNDIEWQESVSKLGDKEIEKVNRLKEIQKMYLKQCSDEDVIRNINKRINVRIKNAGGESAPIEVYTPYPNYAAIKKADHRSFISDIFSSSTIGDGRIMKETDEPKYRGLYYEFNMGLSVLPMMAHLEKDSSVLKHEVEKLINESEWINERTKLYFKRVQSYYNEDEAFEFMHFSVILIEMILRDMYRMVKGTQIQTMKVDAGAQINVNLQDILKDDDIKGFLGENLYKYIEYNLVDDRGLNFRNNILHGLIDIQVFHHNYSRLLMHIFLVIVVHVNSKIEESYES